MPACLARSLANWPFTWGLSRLLAGSTILFRKAPLSSSERTAAPCFSNASVKAWTQDCTATRLCSEQQTMPLLKGLLMTTRVAVCFRCASAQISTGAFPAPTPIAGVPDLYAALTIVGPPVARMNEILGCSIKEIAVVRLFSDCTDRKGCTHCTS